jgi:hypothetical protein
MYMDNTQYKTICLQRIHKVDFMYTEKMWNEYKYAEDTWTAQKFE